MFSLLAALAVLGAGCSSDDTGSDTPPSIGTGTDDGLISEQTRQEIESYFSACLAGARATIPLRLPSTPPK